MSDIKKIEFAVALLEKRYGKNSVMRLGDKSAMRVEVIPTGVLSIDRALVVGGLARGRVVEIFGPEAGGKTTVALQTIAQAQAMGGHAAFIDAEHALDPAYAARLGVDVDALWIAQPYCGEEALEIADGLIKSGEFDIIVIDSVAALVPKAELEGEMGEAQMGLQARLMSQALRKLTGTVAKTRTCLVFINQVRDKIGVMYGSPETTTGGRALKFYASQRLDVRRIGQLKKGEEVVGAKTKIKIVKNKVGRPFLEAEPELYFGKGFSQYADLINLGSDCGVIEKAGAWYSYNGEQLGQGMEQAMDSLAEHPEIAKTIFNQVRQRIMPAPETKEQP